MANMARLINNGKDILGEDQSFACLSGLYNGFFNILERGNYTTEIDLLDAIDKWSNAQQFCRFNGSRAEVVAKVYRTHQMYVRAQGGNYREFGDVTFVLLFSDNDRREGFSNTFQIKVDQSIFHAYGSLFSGQNFQQLNFYRTDFLERLRHPYDTLICDFLHYFLIDSRWPHCIAEIPLSYTWLDDRSSAYWTTLRSLLVPRLITGLNSQSGFDTMLRKQFLSTGINIRRILPLCTKSLHDILEPLVESGVTEFPEKRFNQGNENTPPEKPPFKPPEFALSSSAVVATEIILRNKEE
jgi:hypothetical protein